MFVVASMAYGVSQRLMAYAQMSDALARAAIATAEKGASQIYSVPAAADPHAAVSAVGLGKGVFVDALGETQLVSLPDERGADAAKAQLLAAMAPSILQESGEAP